MKNTIYLDNAATTPLSKNVKDYIISILDEYGNPSSLHSIGEKAKQIIDNARKNVAEFINADVNNIIFTNGGSASNTLAIKGYINRNYCELLYSPTAHKSIIKCAETISKKYVLKVGKTGLIDIEDLENWLKVLQEKAFVVVEYANSEIGTIQNIAKIIKLVHKYHGVVFIDCTGSISTIPINVKELDVDMLAFSGHKIGALKGCGVLYKKSNINLEPLIYGSQEKGLFGGTENVIGIASLGEAVKNYNYKSISIYSRDYVCDYIVKNIPDCYLIGESIESGNRLPHNLFICFKGVEGESLMIMLDITGVAVSTGSACNSNSLTHSSTLEAISVDKDDINSCIRLTFNGQENEEELFYVCEALRECVGQLRNFVNNK